MFRRSDRCVDRSDGGLVMGASLLGVIVNRSVVLVTEILLLYWHSHLFQSRLASHCVLGLLLLGLFDLVFCKFLRMQFTLLLFPFGFGLLTFFNLPAALRLFLFFFAIATAVKIQL